MKFAKEGRAKYISHLDLMHAMQRSMARCQMPLWFTEGFNQHAYVFRCASAFDRLFR